MSPAKAAGGRDGSLRMRRAPRFAVAIACAVLLWMVGRPAAQAQPTPEGTPGRPPTEAATPASKEPAAPLPAAATSTGTHVGEPVGPAGAPTAQAGAAASDAIEAELAATPGLANAERNCADRPIAVAELLDCLGTRCQDREERRKLLSLADLQPGTLLVSGMLLRAIRRMTETGFVRIVAVDCTGAASGARIRLRVIGNKVIRGIRFEGNREIFTAELQARLLFQAGDVLDAETDAGRLQLQRQTVAFETLYQRSGFEQAKIEISAEPVGIGQVGVVVRINEGRRDRVTGLVTVLQDPHRPNDRERAAGMLCPQVRERALLQASDLLDVDVFTRRAEVRARSKIREYLRGIGYHNPRVAIDHDRRDGAVRIDIRLGRCSLVRTLIRESAEQATRDAALRPVEDPTLEAVLPFVESGVFDLSEAERGRRELRAALENRGYLFAEVELDYRETPRSWGSRVVSAITYRITTRYLAQVRGLHFCDAGLVEETESAAAADGCARVAGRSMALPTGELEKAIVTRPYDVLGEGGYLSTAQMLGDLEALRRHYRDSGYFEFHYALVAAPGSQGIQRRRRRTGNEEVIEYLLGDRGFRVRRPIGEHFIYVDVPVIEGRRSRFDAVSVQGASPARLPLVRSLLDLKSGGVASATLLREALQRVQDDYQNLGFFQSKVEAFCSTRGRGLAADAAEGMQPCTPERILAETIDLEVRVHEGPRVRIGELFVAGNFQTRASLLLRDMPAPGSDFSAQRLFESLRALRNLGLFRSVSFQYIGRDEVPARKDIAVVIHVVEDETQHFEASAGFQTVNVNRAERAGLPGLFDVMEHLTSAGSRLGSGYSQFLGLNLSNLLFTLEGKWVERNLDLFGGGKELRLESRLGVTPDITEGPALGLLALVYQDRRLLGSEVSLRFFPGYVSRDFATTAIDVDKAGTAAEVARAFGKLGVSAGLDLGVVRTRDIVAQGAIATWTDLQFQGKLLLRSAYDGLDSPLNPTSGLFGNLSVALINAMVTDSAGTQSVRGTFVKLEGQTKALVTFRDTLTVAAMARAGWAAGFESSAYGRLPDNERYRLGGQLGVRGYADNGILQYGRDGKPLARCLGLGDNQACANEAVFDSGNVVVNGTLEARFPLVRSLDVWSGVFWDWGGISETLGALSSASIRHSVGLGVRWLLAGQIPVRADYGIAVNRRCATLPAADGSCTTEPRGQLHLGLLYSF